MTIQKKNTAIVFCLTTNFMFAVGNAVFDIKRFCTDWVDEVVIIYDGKLRNKDAEIIKNTFPTRFIEYDFPLKDDSVFNQETMQAFTKMVFAKFECLKLLDEYKNVICLDYDIAIVRNFKEILDFPSDYFKILLRGDTVGRQMHKPIPGYDMNREGMCACTFAVNEKLKDYLKIYEYCYRKASEYAEYIKHPEQAIFDLVFQDFKLTPSIIKDDFFISVNDPLGQKNPLGKIIHTGGSYKFWNGLTNEQWNSNYKKWIKLGGSHARTLRPVRVYKNKIKSFFKKLFNK